MARLQPAGNQSVIKLQHKRCLIVLQKGVNKSLKGHLLQAKRALIQSQFMPFRFVVSEFSLQDSVKKDSVKRLRVDKRMSRQVNKLTSRQVNEWTSKRVDK